MTIVIIFRVLFWFTLNVYAIRKPILSDDIEGSTISLCNTNFVISCHGDEPLHWTYFTFYPNNHAKITYLQHIQKGYNFTATLNITNISFEDVSYYYCHYKSESYLEESFSTKFYFYVDDKCQNKLSVIDTHTYNVHLTQYSTGYLPCKPTSPDIHVELYNKLGKKVIEKKTLLWNDFGKVLDYNPQFGWIIEEIYKANLKAIQLKCVFIHRNKNNTRFELIINIYVKQNYTKLLTIKQNSDLSIGKPIHLTCNSNDNNIGNRYHWIISNYKNDNSLEYLNSSLIIPNACIDDEGLYTCVIYNYFTNLSCNKSISIQLKHEEAAPLTIFHTSQLINFGASGENITFSVKFFQTNLVTKWFNNLNELITEKDNRHKVRYIIKRKYYEQLVEESLTIKELTLLDIGSYTFHISNFRPVVFYLKDVGNKPYIISESLQNKVISVPLASHISLDCISNSSNYDKLFWYKNDNEFIPHEHNWNIIHKRTGEIIEVFKSDIRDEGIYECIMSNEYGKTTKYVHIKFRESGHMNSTFYYIIISILIITIMLCVITVLVIKRKLKQKYKKALKLAGLENFAMGAPECINHELDVTEQADLLPYNDKFEFPKSKLKIGSKIGSGAFGIVCQATAFGIIKGQSKTIVAAKMVKNENKEVVSALASELKILTHLGNHINIVNLLGACTKDLQNGELIMIVEYCKFGDLQNYIYKNRRNFIDQLDNISGIYNFEIGRPRSQIASVVFDNKFYNGNAVCVKYAKINNNQSTVSTSSENSNREKSISFINNLETSTSNFIYSEDLIIWSYQIACGMQYLSSRKILHGDLAIRNILLTENNIVKICDFGLAKNIYKNNFYKKTNNGLFPIKWLAIECIQDRIFSTQSDVWAYGIVLWELFSLGQTPYPGMCADENLFNRLVNGYRMNCPEFASDAIYKIMQKCWNGNPLERPSFKKIVDELEKFLTLQTKDILQKQYTESGNDKIKRETDYLSKFMRPDFINFVS